MNRKERGSKADNLLGEGLEAGFSHASPLGIHSAPNPRMEPQPPGDSGASPVRARTEGRAKEAANSPSRAAAMLAAALLVLLHSPARAEEARPPAGAADPYTETVTVTGTRLPDRGEKIRDLPAATTVITRREIDASGARTVQELLSRVAGAIVYDQIGNGAETTFDLRGFGGGHTTVLLDGARINDPRNNSVRLEAIAIEGIDRIEVTRGPAAATVGGGSAGGIVNIVTREGSGRSLPFVSWSGGSHGARRLALGVSGRGGEWSGRSSGRSSTAETRSSEERSSVRGEPSAAGAGPGASRIDWLVTASRDRTDGFRENADARLDRLTAGLGFTPAPGSRLSLTVHAANDTIGAPGALTLGEWDSDPGRSPYNSLDDSSVRYRQGTLNWHGPLSKAVSLAANLSYLDRDTRALTTGRAAVTFGGFHLDAQVRTLSGALQSTATLRTGRLDHAVSFGGEGSGGTSDAEGCGTKPLSLAVCDPGSFLNSSNRTREKRSALFLQDSVRLNDQFTLLGGVRWDRSALDYLEARPDATNDRSKTFSRTSWKAGVTWNLRTAAGLYASYGESFAPPTVEDLFAFPTFGSNPDLDPTLTRSYEIGLRGALVPAGSPSARFHRSFEYAVALYRANVTDEILFDPSSALGPFGANVNAGKSLRTGVEATVAAKIFSWLSASAAYGRTQARFENGQNDGDTVPLVPKNRLSGAFDVALPLGLSARADFLRVSNQVLANDDANGQTRLGGYRVLNARAAWRAIGRKHAGLRDGRSNRERGAYALGALEFFVEARNILDERYATRGIYAYNFAGAPPANTIFVTPAPGRTFMGGATIAF